MSRHRGLSVAVCESRRTPIDSFCLCPLLSCQNPSPSFPPTFSSSCPPSSLPLPLLPSFRPAICFPRLFRSRSRATQIPKVRLFLSGSAGAVRLDHLLAAQADQQRRLTAAPDSLCCDSHSSNAEKCVLYGWVEGILVACLSNVRVFGLKPE